MRTCLLSQSVLCGDADITGKNAKRDRTNRPGLFDQNGSLGVPNGSLGVRPSFKLT